MYESAITDNVWALSNFSVTNYSYRNQSYRNTFNQIFEKKGLILELYELFYYLINLFYFVS